MGAGARRRSPSLKFASLIHECENLFFRRIYAEIVIVIFVCFAYDLIVKNYDLSERTALFSHL